MSNNVLKMPPSRSGGTVSQVESAGSIVVIGANGSGKTRLGWWIEQQSSKSVHRIAAQKSLALPEEVRTWSLEKATENFLYGNTGGSADWRCTTGKLGGRWGGRPATHLLNDIDALMVLLHTEEYEKLLAAKHGRTSSEGRGETKLDVITRMWSDMFPRRRLVIEAGTVKTAPYDAPEIIYNAADMSDGERVVFYLIGECLCALPEATLVIDEPEMHLHKSLVSRLWDLIERERDDCLFVYLTHDVDFAASRKGATYVCLRDYDGTAWDWFIVDEVEEIPEPILLGILGSRKPILFVEGERGSLDAQIYELAYPEWFVVPMGSCAKVVEAVRAFRSRKDLHWLDIRGIVDRDYFTPQQVEAFRNQDIHVLRAASIENILLAEDVLEEAAHLLERDAATLIEAVKKFVMEEYRARRDSIILEAVRQEAVSHLRYPTLEGEGIAAVDSAYRKHVSAFEPREAHAVALEASDKLLSENNYADILASFRSKGLARQVSVRFDMKPKGYIDYVIRMAKADRREMRQKLRQQLPDLD